MMHAFILQAVQSLVSSESSLAANREKFTGLVTSVGQRLRWAAGANPSLAGLLDQFEANVGSATNDLSVSAGRSLHP